MDCKTIQRKIDELTFEGKNRLGKDEMEHVDSCPTCHDYYEESVSTANILRVVKETEPELSNPGQLTDSIMQAVANEEQYHVNQKQNGFISLRTFTRILAAAVFLLCVTLGIEQYLILNKIQNLEQKLGKVHLSPSYPYGIIQKAEMLNLEPLLQFYQRESNQSLNKISSMLKLRYARQLNFTFYDVKRFINKDKLLQSELIRKSNQK